LRKSRKAATGLESLEGCHGPNFDGCRARGNQGGCRFDGRAAGGHDIVDEDHVLTGHPARIRGKGPTQVGCARHAIESDLRRRRACSPQCLPGEFEVQQAGRDARDFVRLVEAPLDEARRVQRHWHDQCRALRPVVQCAGCMRRQSRAENPRVCERAFVLEGLHQVGDRKLIGPRRHAPEIWQAERAAMITAGHVRAASGGARQATTFAGIQHDRDFRLAVRAQVVRRALAGTAAQDAPWWQHPPDPTVEIRVNLAAGHWLTGLAGVRILPGRCSAQRGLAVGPLPAVFLPISTRFTP
jgi:hypothetical protein